MDANLCSFILAHNIRDKGLRTIKLTHLKLLLVPSKNSVISWIQKFNHESQCPLVERIRICYGTNCPTYIQVRPLPRWRGKARRALADQTWEWEAWSKVVIYFDGKTHSFIEGYHPFHPKKVESKSPKGFEEVALVMWSKAFSKLRKKNTKCCWLSSSHAKAIWAR